MNHPRNATVVASDLSCRPMAVSKPIVQVLHYNCSPGKSSPESTNKTMDASSCTSWSEYSGSSNNSRGGTNFGASRRGFNPTLVSRSSPELESVNEDDAGESIDQYEQDEVSVITDPSKSAETDDHHDKDELIARLSMQVAVLQQKVASVDKKNKKQLPPSLSQAFHSKLSAHVASDNDDDQVSESHFPTLTTVSKPADLRNKFAKRGKSVRRFNSEGSMEKSNFSTSFRRAPATSKSSDLSNTCDRESLRKDAPEVPQSSFRVEQAQLDLQKSFSLRRSSRGVGQSTSGASSMSSLDSRGSQDSNTTHQSVLRRGSRRPVPSPVLKEESSDETSSSECSESDFSFKSPTRLRQAFANMKSGKEDVGSESQQQSNDNSMASMRHGGPVRRMNLTEISKEDFSQDFRRASAMNGQSVRNMNARSKSSDCLQQTTNNKYASDDKQGSNTSDIFEDKGDSNQKLPEAWQCAYREESATVFETGSGAKVDDEENSEILLNSASCALQETSQDASDGAEHKDSGTAMVYASNEYSADDSVSSVNTENYKTSPAHKIHLMSGPRTTENFAVSIDESVRRNSIAGVSETTDTESEESAQLALFSKKSGQKKAMEDLNGKDDDDILWSPSEFATDEAFQQSHTSFASVSSSNAYLEGLPYEVVAPSKTMKMKMKARRRASFGILNARSADRDMTRVLRSLEGSFSLPDDASIDPKKKPNTKLATMANASLLLKRRGLSKNDKESSAMSSTRSGIFQKLISLGRKSKRDASAGETGPDSDAKISSIEFDLSMQRCSSKSSPKECQFESSLLSIGYSSAGSSVFYASYGSLDEVPKAKPARSVTNSKIITSVFDMSRSAGEFEDLWKSKVRTGLDLSTSSVGDDETEANVATRATRAELALTESFRQTEIALDEVQRAIDRARTPHFEQETAANPIAERREQMVQKSSKKSVCFNLLFEEDEADGFYSAAELLSEKTQPTDTETAKSDSPPRPMTVSPVQRFRRPRHGRLKASDDEAKQMTLVDL